VRTKTTKKGGASEGPAGVALLSKLTRTKKDRVEFEQTRVCVEAAENLSQMMHALGVTRSELARRMDVDRAQVTRLLQGGNVSLERLAAAAHALGMSLHVHLGPLALAPKLVAAKRERVPKAAKVTRVKRT
jgi:plasmid maintenance system antidote protein VapI